MWFVFAFCYALHACFFEEGVVFCHDCYGFYVWCSCLWEGFADEFCAESDAAVFWVDDYAAYGADFSLQLLQCAFPDFGSAETYGCWVAVDDGADGLVFVF